MQLSTREMELYFSHKIVCNLQHTLKTNYVLVCFWKLRYNVVHEKCFHFTIRIIYFVQISSDIVRLDLKDLKYIHVVKPR